MKKTKNRILDRVLAQDVPADELKQANGGMEGISLGTVTTCGCSDSCDCD